MNEKLTKFCNSMVAKVAPFCKNMLDWFKSDRCFVKYFIDAFAMTNRNLVLLSMLILFVFGTSMYIFVTESNGVNFFYTFVVVILLMSALASGFFYSIKKSIKLQYNVEKSEENANIGFGTFYSGIGKYYLRFMGILVLFFVMASILIIGIFILANQFICNIADLGIDGKFFFNLLAADPNVIDSVLSNLDKTQQVYFRNWNRLFLIGTQLFTIMLIFWIPESIYQGKNIFVSLFKSIVKVIKDFPNVLRIYLTILLLNYITAIFTVVFANNPIVLFVLSIFSFYLCLYDFYAIFLYYKSRYVDEYDRG